MAEMKDYNGFSGEVRGRGGYWQKGAYMIGLRPKPSKCAACGQDKGVITGHWETYFEPFALNEDIPLCSTCHLMVHCRGRFKDRFAKYAENVAVGFTPVKVMHSFDWNGFRKTWLEGETGGEWEPSPNPGDPDLLRRIGSGEQLALALIRVEGLREKGVD